MASNTQIFWQVTCKEMDEVCKGRTWLIVDVLEIQSLSTCALVFYLFFEDLVMEARSISNCTPINRRDNKTKLFFSPRYFGVFSGQIKIKGRFWTPTGSLKECKHQSLKRKPGWNARLFLRNHQLLCLKTWEEKSMTFPISMHRKLASSWTLRTILYTRFLPLWW